MMGGGMAQQPGMMASPQGMMMQQQQTNMYNMGYMQQQAAPMAQVGELIASLLSGRSLDNQWVEGKSSFVLTKCHTGITFITNRKSVKIFRSMWTLGTMHRL